MEPHVAHYLESVLRALPVAFEHHVGFARADDDLAGGVGRQLYIVVVDDAHVEVLGIAFAGAVRAHRRAEGQNGR
ncbi:hypothetical protein D9M69_612130 [compost metagenome]